MNALNSTPQTFLRPTEPTVRFLTSGAVPMASLPLCFARQEHGEGVLHRALLGGRGLGVEVVQQCALVLRQRIDVSSLQSGMRISRVPRLGRTLVFTPAASRVAA